MKSHPSLLTYHLTRRSRFDPPFNDAVWAITFSDLLTLLFSFFIAMVSFSPLGQSPVPAALPETNPPQVAEIEENEAGTSLAIAEEGVSKRVFELRREELSRIAAGDTADTLEEMKKIIISNSYDNRRVTITVSPAVESDWQGERWLSIIQRLAELQRQVFDAQPKTPLKLRISEPYPRNRKAEGQTGHPDAVLALIEVEEVSRSNG